MLIFDNLRIKTSKKLLPEGSPKHFYDSLFNDLRMLPFDDLVYMSTLDVPLNKITKETLKIKVGNTWLNRFINRYKLAVLLARAKETGGFERLEFKYFWVEL